MPPCPFTPESDVSSLICPYFQADHITCTDPVDPTYCGKRMELEAIRAAEDSKLFFIELVQRTEETTEQIKQNKETGGR